MEQRLKIKNKKRLSAKTKVRIFFAVVLVIIALIFFYYIKVVCPIIVKLSEEKIRSVATSAISEVVGDVMKEGNLTYSDLVKITYSSNSNKVELIEIDTVTINVIIREITKGVQDKFNSLSSEGINIALGTFTGIPFLYGIGPDISVKLVPVGTVNTAVHSNFNAAGINQTHHRLYFEVSSVAGMVLPAMTRNFTTTLEVLLCESIIVGEIPSVYLNGGLI